MRRTPYSLTVDLQDLVQDPGACHRALVDLLVEFHQDYCPAAILTKDESMAAHRQTVYRVEFDSWAWTGRPYRPQIDLNGIGWRILRNVPLGPLARPLVAFLLRNVRA